MKTIFALVALTLLAGCSTQNLNVSWSFGASYNTNARMTTDVTHLRKGE